jgi:hypothetical protein
MYERQITIINERIDKFTEKAHLKRRPKFTRLKRTSPPASANGVLNRLYVSDNFLELWQRGFYDEKDLDGLLAHEFGHFIAYQKSRFEVAKTCVVFLYFMLLVGLVFCWGFYIPEPAFLTALTTVLITLCWLCFLPWIARTAYVPGEFEADHNAIVFKLADAQQLADARLKRMSAPRPRKLGPGQTLEFLWSILTHPSLNDELQNLGLDMEVKYKVKGLKI